MNRAFLLGMSIAAVVAASCGGKVIVDGPPPGGTGGAGSGGSGGTTNMTTTADGAPGQTSTGTVGTTTVAATTTGTGQATTGTGAPPPCDPNYTCAEAITPPNGNPNMLCAGTPAADAYDVLLKCICGGPCAASCSANVCIGQPATANCTMCIQDFQKGCGKAFTNCANN